MSESETRSKLWSDVYFHVLTEAEGISYKSSLILAKEVADASVVNFDNKPKEK